MKNKVLIIEDEKAIRDMYSTMLVSDGYEVLQAEKGMEGYALAIKENPAIILLDYRLPDTTGLEVLKMLNKNSVKIPVLIITNYIADINEEEVKKAGALEIVLKYDITPSLLLNKVKKYIKK